MNYVDSLAIQRDAPANSYLAIIVDICRRDHGFGTGWRITHIEDASEPWIRFRCDEASPPAQGWKLHVSAGLASAEEVLSRALPVLFGEDAGFKAASSMTVLDHLNNSNRLGQIGKFMTVYPNSDAQAVRLAVKLDLATRGLTGPTIRSDRPLRSGSLVSYRYGGFDRRQIQTPLGETIAAISAPSGELIPDRRLPIYQPPAWAVDPFVAAGVAADLPPDKRFFRGRFVVVGSLHESPRGTVHLAWDNDSLRACVLKRAPRCAMQSIDGRDARDRLRHEATVLTQLAPDSRFPVVYDLFEEDDDLWLAMEDVAGETIEHRVAGLRSQGRWIPPDQLLAWSRELADILGAIHAKGFVYRDLKSANIIVAPDGRLRLIDFDLVFALGSAERPFGRGTRGYRSPQQEGGAEPTISDDVYGLGAMIYFLATSAEPSQAPRPFALLDRPVSALNPELGLGLEPLLMRCLDHEPANRFPSTSAVDNALVALSSGPRATPPAVVPEPGLGQRSTMERNWRDLARRLGDTLSAVAQPLPDRPGLAWASAHPIGSGLGSIDINIGSGGPVLALAELVAEFGGAEHRAALIEGAHGLVGAQRPGGAELAGFYVGDAGVGAAILRAGQVLGDRDLIAAAVAKGRCIAAASHTSPDLFNGTAGRLRFHLLLWDETGEPEHLAAATAAGRALLAARDASDAPETRWTIPAGFGNLSGQAYLGYAHGAAGIADALLDLFEVTADEQYLAAARAAGRWLARRAVPVLEDGSGFNWPDVEGKQPGRCFWCHGAMGIGRFLLHAADLDVLPEATELAAGAGRAVAHATRWAGPTQCHGLSGNAEYLLDLFQATGDVSYRAEAYALASVLDTFSEEQDGLLVWPSESPWILTPDYMVGYAGVAVCLLRLAASDTRPHQLSRRGFRFRPAGGTAELAARDNERDL